MDDSFSHAIPPVADEYQDPLTHQNKVWNPSYADVVEWLHDDVDEDTQVRDSESGHQSLPTLGYVAQGAIENFDTTTLYGMRTVHDDVEMLETRPIRPVAEALKSGQAATAGLNAALTKQTAAERTYKLPEMKNMAAKRPSRAEKAIAEMRSPDRKRPKMESGRKPLGEKDHNTLIRTATTASRIAKELAEQKQAAKYVSDAETVSDEETKSESESDEEMIVPGKLMETKQSRRVGGMGPSLK